MTRFVCVIPSRVPTFTDACTESMAPMLRDNLLVVDNTYVNRGVPAAWNAGARRAEAEGADWLVIVSAGVRFGPSGGTDLIEACGRPEHQDVVAVEAGGGLGWHLIAVSMDAYRRVGPFDEGFFPAYHEEAEWSYRAFIRCGLSEEGPWWPKVDTDARLVETAHAIKHTDIPIDYMANLQRFIDLTGGEPGREAFRSTNGLCPTCGKVWHTESPNEGHVCT